MLDGADDSDVNISMLSSKGFYRQHSSQVLRSLGDPGRFVRVDFRLLLVFLDAVPIVFLLAYVAFIDFEKQRRMVFTVLRSNAYSVFYFILYFTDLLLTGTAIRTLHIKTNQLSASNTVGFKLGAYKRRRKCVMEGGGLVPSTSPCHEEGVTNREGNPCRAARFV